jgi:hypothetical protein
MWAVAGSTAARRRSKVTVSVDPRLLEVVDSYLDAHPGVDWGRIFDQALYLWYHALLDEARAEAMAFDGRLIDLEESRAWRHEVDPALLAKLADPEHH